MEKTSAEIARESAEKTASRIEKASVGAQEMLEHATSAAVGATERMGAASAELAESATRWTEATRERVRRNPLASIGIAVGVAVATVLGAGMFLQRRGHGTERHSHTR